MGHARGGDMIVKRGQPVNSSRLQMLDSIHLSRSRSMGVAMGDPIDRVNLLNSIS